MKKLMMAVATAMAIGFSAFAANEAWFYGGISNSWPNATCMSGGTWSNTTDQATLEWGESHSNLVVEADATNALAFVATSAKTVGSDVQSVTYSADIEFFPFLETPDIPTSSKAGVAIVTNTVDSVDEAYFWVLAKDPDSGTGDVAASNIWTKTTVDAVLDEEVPVTIVVTNCASSGIGSAVYTIGEGNDASTVTKTVVIGDNKFSTINFSGDGTVAELVGQFDTKVALTLPTKPTYVQTIVVSNKTTSAVVAEQSGAYEFTVGDEYAIWYYAMAGYLFADGKDYKVAEGTMNGNVDLSETTPEDPTVAKAQIGSQLYLTLTAAIAAVQADETITLLEDSSDIIAYEGALAFTIDLNGRSWMPAMDSDDVAVLKVDNASAAITIKGNADGEGSVKAAYGSAIWARQGTVAIQSGAFTNDSATVATIRAGDLVEETSFVGAVTITGGQFVNLSAEAAAVNLAKDGEGSAITVSGGKFTVKPDTAFLASGVQAIEKDGWWIVKAPAAKVGDNYYDSLDEALAAAESGSTKTVVLCSNVSQASLTVPSGVTLDLTESFTISGLETVVNNGTIVVYDLTAATALKDVPGTLKAGKEIGSEAAGKLFPINTTVTLVEEAVGTCTVPKQTIVVPSGTLYWGDVINPYQQVSITGNAKLGNNVSAGQSEQLVTKLTVTGDLEISTDISIGAFAEVSVSGTITLASEKTITLKATTSKLTNSGSLVANTDVVTDVENYTVVKNDSVYTIAAGAAKIGTKVYLTFNEAVQEAQSGDTITIIANCEGSQEASFDGLTISINEGVTFTANIAKINRNLVITGAGNLATKGAANIEVAATLDLSDLSYKRTTGCGKFDIDATGIVKYPGDIASPAWAPVVQYAISSAADGAQVYTDTDNGTGGNPYTYGNGVWAAGAGVTPVAKITKEGVSYEIGFATISAALTSTEAAGATVTLLADSAVSNVQETLSTGATCIDYNGKSAPLVNSHWDGANVKGGKLTFTAASGEIVIRNGTDLNHNVREYSVKANVNLVISNMTYYGSITPSGADNAVVMVKDCTFSNLYDNEGKTAANGKYTSYNLALSNLKCSTIFVVGNEFHPMQRPAMAMTAQANNQNTTVYVYNNMFNADKSTQADKYYPHAMQLYYAKAVYFENNTFQGQYAQGIFAAKKATNPSIICRGNTLAADQNYVWVLHDGEPFNGKLNWGLNTFQNPDISTTNGLYGTIAGAESNYSYVYEENTAIPSGYDSFYAWATGADAAKKYFVKKSGVAEGEYVATLDGLAAGDQLLVDPMTSVTIPSGLAFVNVASSDSYYGNYWNVITKPTALTVNVTLGDNVTSVKYNGTTYTKSFQLADVAPSTTLEFSEITYSGEQYIQNVSTNGNLTGSTITREAASFIVAADLTNPNASIAFNAAVVEAVVYSTAEGHAFIKRCTSFAIVQDEAKTPGQWVKLFKQYIGAGTDGGKQLNILPGEVHRYDFNGFTYVSPDNADWFASVEPVSGTTYAEYTGYATPEAALAAKGSSVTYVIAVDDADLSKVTLTLDKLSFKGILWKGYNRWSTIDSNKEPACDVTKKTAKWGWDSENHTFEYVAESNILMKVGDIPYDSLTKACSEAADKTVVFVANVTECATSTVAGVTLDLEGFQLTSANADVPALVVKGGTLNISNAIITASTKAIYAEGESTVVNIIDGLYAGVLEATSPATINILGGYLIDNGTTTITFTGNVKATGGKFTANAKTAGAEIPATDYAYVAFANPVTKSDYTFTYEIMTNMTVEAGDSTLVWNVATNGTSDTSIGGVQLPDSFVTTVVGSETWKSTSEGKAAAQNTLNADSGYTTGGSTGKIKKWECYVLGMDEVAAGTSTTKGPRAEGVQDTKTDKIGFRMATPDNVVRALESGCEVKYEVEAYDAPGGSKVEAECSSKVDYTENAEVPNPSAVRYYKMKVYVSPKK